VSDLTNAVAERVAQRDLRIADVRTVVVNLPLEAEYVWATGRYPGATKVVVEVVTEGGLIGLGEAPHWRHAQLIESELKERLCGLQANDLHECWRRAVPPVESLRNTDGTDVVKAYGGIEIALWDIRAKAAGVPLYQFLGGASRKAVTFSEYFSARIANERTAGESTPEEIGDYCRRMVEEHDSPVFEGKVGFCDLRTDIAIARAVREAIGPDRVLRLDANMAWRLPTAHRALAELAEFDIANVEDPVSSFEEMQKLRYHSAIPFSTHVPDLRRAVALGVPDTFVLNVTALGGIERTLRFVAACQEMGVGFSFYSGDTGIATAAYLHLASADAYLDAPSQSLLRWYTDDVIEGGPFRPESGVVQVPEGDGLGVTLDRSAIASAHDRFLRDGPIDQFGVDDRGIFATVPAY
jgi:glucarate dehydratase